MCLLIAALLFVVIGSATCADLVAPLNMDGVTGLVSFNSTSQTALVNISGAGSCGSLNFSLSEFPVMYGHFRDALF
ncbi:hypothetical protein FQA47_015742 [Oryzias melastigma]|uniref:Uncharacterized protein n=1 Tax=Oryzias melastigma TaxID=30732 RepID=A0A834F730_ORYME|nr:hypothetical protein FQA47_015742 [Oryzias melastigma]